MKVRGWCSCAHGETRVILELEAGRSDAVKWADAFLGAHSEHAGFRFEVRPFDKVAGDTPRDTPESHAESDGVVPNGPDRE